MAFSGISLEITLVLHNSGTKQQTAMNTDSSITSQWNLRAPASGWKQDRLLIPCSASRCPAEGFSSIMFPFLVSRRASSGGGGELIPWLAWGQAERWRVPPDPRGHSWREDSSCRVPLVKVIYTFNTDCDPLHRDTHTHTIVNEL